MNKLTNTLNEMIYTDTCDNGLKIVVWHKPDFATTACLFATPYGSLDSSQKTETGELLQFPEGIAHFLEHKLFESEEGDVMNEYASMGANVNAFTSYNETVYYFDTCDENIERPLNLLLDFVQDLRISEESVEKEKGIINQELNMYLEMPDSRLIFETLKSLYKNHPIKNDIGGTCDSVNRTTKEDLMKCYALNYHPAKMTLIAVTPVEPNKIIQLIKENQAKKTFPTYSKITREFELEPLEVAKPFKTINMDVVNQKTCYGFKFNVMNQTDEQRVKTDWAFRFIFESHFTSMNPSYQTWITEHKISPYFYYETDFSRDYALALFFDEGVDEKAFGAFVQEEINTLKENGLSPSALIQLKNRSLGETLSLFNQPDEITVQYFRHQLTGVNLFETIDLIKNLTVEDCNEIIRKMDFSNFSETIIKSAK
ncbi:EF-P 5-aminopentanol modification-associated protein YfmH [Anaerorhabdus sp.]|uniref:EF-P 5-aminopentanol modification-associated protein YfmH n=1 Tax=Anaerorhabdus sp. TaxID=1872524 RepID=UPI002FC820DE